MNEQKVKGLIGIAKKAGKITSGSDKTLEGVRGGGRNGVKLLLCSADASPNTLKRIKNSSEYYNVPMNTLSIDKEELARITGYRGGELSVIGIIDAGFAKAITEALSEQKQ